MKADPSEEKRKNKKRADIRFFVPTKKQWESYRAKTISKKRKLSKNLPRKTNAVWFGMTQSPQRVIPGDIAQQRR
ncbi:MAG: hypothetical protein ABJQ90_18745 [Parasphingorhabdus sp.]